MASELTRKNSSSSSRRNWAGGYQDPADVLRQRSIAAEEGDERESLMWAALEKLPTYDRMRKGIIRQTVDGGGALCSEVDIHRLRRQDRKLLLDRIFRVVEEDNERFLKRLRDRMDRSKQQDIFDILGAIYAAIFFLGASNAIAVQPIVGIERTVFYRERAAGMYSALAYALAQVSIEMVYILAQGLLYSLLLFSMIGFIWQATTFFWFFFFIFMSFAYFVLHGMMIVALTPDHQVASILSSFFYTFWNLFSGFLIPRPSIPVWWRWYYWGDPVAWTIYGVVASQLGQKENLIDIPGESRITVKQFLEDNLGYEHSFLGYVALAHLGFALVFFLVFGYSIKCLNFQKR
ncbi:ABC transporter G family member 43-like [Musa acuminata AAA Group]|uniref:ABC transporter G family member 43-like n=1 Tax=Musa acuminata AAA Group TaxID=214697 RepID=UPI0031D20939